MTTHRLTDRLAARLQSRFTNPEAGMTTAEYAIGTIAAASFASLLYKVLVSSQMRAIIVDLLKRAMNDYGLLGVG